MAYINEDCISCAACSMTGPSIFGWDAENMKPTVIKQPETPEEQADFENAKQGCPVEAIKDWLPNT